MAGLTRARLNFLHPDSGDGVMDDRARENIELSLVRCEIDLLDMRLAALTFGGNAVALLADTAPLDRPTDEEDIARRWFPTTADLIRTLTGAADVICFGAVLRATAADGGGPRRAPAHVTHIDYDVASMRLIATHVARNAGRADLVDCPRVMLINAWRPLAPVERDCLAVADGRSIRFDSLRRTVLRGSISGLEEASGWNVIYDAGQRWYCAPAMVPGEVLLFRQADTDEHAAQRAAHSAAEMLDAAADAPPRESLEIRAIAYLPATA